MPSMARASTSSSKGSTSSWRFTKVMNMSDLSRDDDFLSHLLVEKLGTGGVPLLVHKMDPSRRLPKTDAGDLLQIVRRLVVAKGPQATVIREAVDDLLVLASIRYYVQSYTQKQINAFATHASRYLELYLPSGSIEIAHTSRYAHFTGKSELCILASRPLAIGAVITELKGSMADLTDEEDRELKRATTTGLSGIRRDFSVIHSKQLKKNHLFLGPARFVNHDCGNNVELFREGRYITFRVVKPIGIGEEVTAHYGDDYFGRRNRHCLCQSCEKNTRGGYAPDDQEPESSSSDSDDSDRASSSSETEKDTEPVNLNERRTRRGIYAVMPEPEPTAPKIELEDTALPSSPPNPPIGLATPESISRAPSISSSLTSLSSTGDDATLLNAAKRVVPIRPSTRLQITSNPPERQLLTPPLSADPSASVRSSARLQARVGDKPDASGSRLATPKSRKTETVEPESRVLRPRPQADSASAAPKSPPKPSKGKKSAAEREMEKLPTCSTCKGVLPIICVDDEVIWGLLPESEGGKRKGKNKATEEKRECPRCLRHYAIYNVPWPSRVPAHGGSAFEAVPRREKDRMRDMFSSSRRGSSVASSLRTVDKSKSKARRDDEDGVDERPSKKRKLGDIGKARDSLSKKAKAVLGVAKRPVGRPRKNVTTSPKSKQKRGQESSDAESDSSSEEEGNDSPQQTSRLKKAAARPVTEKEQKPSSPPKPRPVKPLVTRVYKPSRDQRASARASLRAKMEVQAKVQVQEASSNESDVVMVELDPASAHLSSDNSDVERESVHSSGAPRLRYNGASYLFHAPNPLSFARRKWVPVPVDPDQDNESERGPPVSTSTNRSTSDEEETLGPVTPDDAEQLGSVPVADEDLEDDLPALLVPRASVFGRAMKPSPVNFAIRRWSGLSAGIDKDKDRSSEDDNAVGEDERRTPPLTRKYVPSRIWEAGSPSKQSPDGSRFLLRRTDSFSSPSATSATDDSQAIVEQLISVPSPSTSDASDETPPAVVTLAVHAEISCASAVEPPKADVYDPSSRLVKAGWDMDMN